MYNIRLENYVPEPRPATTDHIIAAHYYAAWKKNAAQIHGAFDDLTAYPERTPLMGYYDEENPEVCDWEIKWAVEHGINCFIHCWYRNLENMGKPLTPNDLRCGHGLHEALFNAKYQKYMKFAIMFENSPRWGTAENLDDLLNNLMPFWVEQYFSRDNYLKIDNKPVMFIYYPKRLQEVFGTPEAQKAAYDACRKEAVDKYGFDGMIFAVCDTVPTEEANNNALARGYDFRFGYNAGYISKDHYPEAEEIIEAQLGLLKTRLDIDSLHFIPTPSCFSDPTPRTTPHWMKMGYGFNKSKIWYLEPDEYRKLLRSIKEKVDALPENAWAKKIIMIDNWNEWDEGHFVAPSIQFGFRYLQAIREELTQRDNLPDYRSPWDMGLQGNLNKNWDEPDFGLVCATRRFKK